MNEFQLFDLYFEEDCPYLDETTELLEIEGDGVMNILTRERGVAACVEELADYLSYRGLKVRSIKNGSNFEAGDVIISAKGDLRKLFRFWRVSQTFLSITCAIATKTRELVEKARKVNPDIVIATTRKTHPGMRVFEIKAVLAGGGNVHRNSLSDSILITANHLRVCDSIDVKTLKKKTLRCLEVEADPFEFAKVDVLLLDHYTPEQLKSLVPEIRKINPAVKIAVAGNIGDNVEDYAKYADVIVTSLPYYAKPLDLTCRIERI